MKDGPDQSSRGCGDVPTLLLVLAYGAVIIVNPTAGLWLFRVGKILVAVFVLYYAVSWHRDLRNVVGRPRRASAVSVAIALGLGGFWVWYTARGIAAGQWLDAVINVVLAGASGYLYWVASRHGGHG